MRWTLRVLHIMGHRFACAIASSMLCRQVCGAGHQTAISFTPLDCALAAADAHHCLCIIFASFGHGGLLLLLSPGYTPRVGLCVWFAQISFPRTVCTSLRFLCVHVTLAHFGRTQVPPAFALILGHMPGSLFGRANTEHRLAFMAADCLARLRSLRRFSGSGHLRFIALRTFYLISVGHDPRLCTAAVRFAALVRAPHYLHTRLPHRASRSLRCDDGQTPLHIHGCAGLARAQAVRRQTGLDGRSTQVSPACGLRPRYLSLSRHGRYRSFALCSRHTALLLDCTSSLASPAARTRIFAPHAVAPFITPTAGIDRSLGSTAKLGCLIPVFRACSARTVAAPRMRAPQISSA